MQGTRGDKSEGTAGASAQNAQFNGSTSADLTQTKVAEHSPPVSSSVKASTKKQQKKVGFFAIFRFADPLDVFLMILGTLLAMAVGVGTPVTIYYYGQIITQFVVHQQLKNLSMSLNASTKSSNTSNYKCYQKIITESRENVDTLLRSDSTSRHLLDVVFVPEVAAFIGITCSVIVLGYFAMSSWVLTSERQVRRVRLAFFQSVLRQDIGWFDVTESRELNTRLVSDMDRLHDGLGDKVTTFVQWMTAFVSCLIMCLVQSWKLALVAIATTPLLVLAVSVMGRVLRTFVQKEMQAYARAGSVATEVLTAIKTVTAFGGQTKAIQKYQGQLGYAKRESIKKGIVAGVAQGLTWLARFGSVSLTFWYGGKLIREECMESGNVIQIFFGILLGFTNLGQAAPLFDNFSNARVAAASLFEIIDTKSKIDSWSEAGLKPEITGNVEFKDIRFSYPARKDVKVINGLSLKINAGQTVALVGSSGCGKSTLIQLLLRFYDPLDGQVTIDGLDIKQLNVRWLRGLIGVVGQEPVLFGTSIEDNIKLGSNNASDADVERAAREANCYDFIDKLPQKFKTLVGERGAQLSGGQKQRIAIARAIVGNPKILLLDEATSALDTESEAVVQAALDKAGKGRTTIVVAHRLSTVRRADVIFGLQNGLVVESGTHDELMVKKGLYFSLNIQQQQQGQVKCRKDASELDTGRNVGNNAVLEDGIASENLPAKLENYEKAQKNTSAITSSEAGNINPDHRKMPEDSASEEEKFSGEDAGGDFTRYDALRASLKSLRSVIPEPLFNDKPIATAQRDSEKAATSMTPSRQVSFGQILRLNLPEIAFIIVGTIASLASGAVQPIFAVTLSQIFGVFSDISSSKEQEDNIAFWSGMMMVIGTGAGAVVVLQAIMFSISGERMTERLRLQSFQALMRQEMAWFDQEKNRVGVLTTQLATDASGVKGAIGARISMILQSAACIVAALIISYTAEWRLALVLTAVFPITVAGGLIQGRVLQSYAIGDKAAIEEGGKLAQEVITNIRTVVGLNKEAYFMDLFAAHFAKLYKHDQVKALTYGIVYSSSQSIYPLCFSICYSFGAYLIDAYGVPFNYVLRVFGSLVIGGLTVGQMVAGAPDFIKAKASATKLMSLLDRKPEIDSMDTSGVKLENCEGNVKFSKVAFCYPTRPSIPILRDLSVEVSKGQRLALVGASGCGKSTAIALLERFYDPIGGSVTMDGQELQVINVQSLRQNLGIVSQEPILFDASIAENIAYGDNTRQVSITEIMDAARQANIHDFITSLPQGYETNVGDKGTQLSGGQKQRVAIARALLRNPKVLLLDEATSALDTESEKVVQEALEKAQEGRTCIVIAHRLSTIRNAHKIAVISQGGIAEIGTHDELLALGKLYYSLVSAQTH